MILLLAAVAAAADCPSLDTEVERATSALVAGDFPGARTALDTAATSFTCAVATPAQAARYWLVEGALAQLQGDAAAARAPLAAARATDPGVFDERLGPKVRAAWTAAASDGAGTLLLDPPRTVLLDGVPVSAWPAELSATPHLVQVVSADGTVRFAKVIGIGPGEDALVETGLGLGPDPVVQGSGVASAVAPVAPRKAKSPALLILAGVAAAGAGACAGGAVMQTPQMESADSVDALNAAFDRQKAFTYSTWGLAGAAALSVGVHFVIK